MTVKSFRTNRRTNKGAYRRLRTPRHHVTALSSIASVQYKGKSLKAGLARDLPFTHRMTSDLLETDSVRCGVSIKIMAIHFAADDGPEIFIALAAAVGTDLDRVIGKINDALQRVR